ncbi:MAG: glycosyltransferase family 2 protein [Flavobacteriales bacterium]|nr:glycosyltransferase family 2 protein [Flavobacteriales bacterium]
MIIDVIIPAFNEADAIGMVLQDIPKHLIRHIVVVNNGSTDETASVAASCGAIVVNEPQRGYGNACLAAMAHLAGCEPQPQIVVFLDADHSDHPEQLGSVVDPILKDEADLVIGSRALGEREAGSMMPQQVFGNWLATRLMRWSYGIRYTDLGPFRAIRWSTLMAIGMRDRTFGWTVEMQLKASRGGWRHVEVPVDYRKRIGVSKVSGTVKGSVLAGYRIIATILKHR